MDKYRKGIDKKFKPETPLSKRMLPINEGQEALARASFATHEKEAFFDGAYADILGDLFLQWLRSSHHERETREYLYATAMALGSVKERLIQIEQYGKNVPFIEKMTPTHIKSDDTLQGGLQ